VVTDPPGAAVGVRKPPRKEPAGDGVGFRMPAGGDRSELFDAADQQPIAFLSRQLQRRRYLIAKLLPHPVYLTAPYARAGRACLSITPPGTENLNRLAEIMTASLYN
jgi:hypothetical protein